MISSHSFLSIIVDFGVSDCNLMHSVDMFLALDKDMNGTLSKQELREYADGTLTEIFIERGKHSIKMRRFSFNLLYIYRMVNNAYIIYSYNLL